MSIVVRVTFRRLKLPLVKPYRLSYRTFHEFEPYVIEIEDSDGRVGYGAAHISPGSSSETREGGLAYLKHRLPRLIGLKTPQAKALMLAQYQESKVATTAVVTALEVLEAMPVLNRKAPATLPLLVPVSALDQAGIETEVETAIAAGFRTLKIKVGQNVDTDVTRVGWIQNAVAGRATLRIDANRAYDREAAIAFVRKVDPDGIVLFEQPCEADQWDDNAAVAVASDIPLMLDEPISTLEDIERAAEIPGVAFCKVKLKRLGSVARLIEGIQHIQAHGMQAVLGDGLGCDLHAWFEACVAADHIDNAGEFNGWLKLRDRLFTRPLVFENGSMTVPAGPCPGVDRERLAAASTLTITYDKKQYKGITDVA